MNDTLTRRQSRAFACAMRAGLFASAFVLAGAAGQTVLAKTDESVTGTFVAEHGATTTPTGGIEGRVDPSTGVMTFTLSFDGLSGPPTVAHFHGPAAPGQDAGVMEPIELKDRNPLHATVTFNPSDLAALRQGLVYVNLHTTRYPTGEARAQLHLRADAQ